MISFRTQLNRLAITLLLGGFTFLLVGFAFTTYAQFTPEINYQGKLNDSAGVPVSDGSYSVAFRLYTTASGGSAIWSETVDLTLSNGLFSHLLGSSSAISGVDFNQPLYLGVEVEGDGEMTPRKQLAAVPAAFEARNAQTLDNIATTSFLRADQADAASGLLTFTGGFVSTASSTVSELNTSTTTVTTFVIDGQEYTSISGGSTGLTNNGGTLTANISESNLNITGSPTDDYILVASSTAAGGFAWAASSTIGVHDAVTLAGTPDYLTLSGQEITLGTVDISDDTSLTVGATGLELSDDDLVLSTGYAIPLTASTTNWNTFYNTPSNRITAGTDLSWSGNTLNYTGTDSDTQLTEEEVEDFAFNGAFTGNTETLITVTYQTGDNTVDLAVNDDLSQYDNTTSGFITGNETITLSGDVTGSGATSITTSLATNSVGDNEIDYGEVRLSDFSDDVGYLTDILSESLESLSDVDTFTQSSGDILYWTGTGWNVTATSSWDTDTQLSENSVESYIFDADAETISGNWDNSANPWDISSETNLSATGGITLTDDQLSLTNDFGASIDSSEITNGTIIEADLSTDVTAVDGDFLQYDSTGDNFTWRDASQVLSDIGAEADLANEAGLYAALTDVSQFWEAGDTLSSGAISSGFGNIDIGSSNLTVGGTVQFSALGNGILSTDASGNLSTTSVSASNLADGDFGDFTVSGGVASLDSNVVGDNEIDYGEVRLSDFSDDVGYLTDILSESLESLSDVDTFTQSSGDILYWTGTGWNVTATSSWDTDTQLSVGSDNQIPYTNSGGDDFDYSSNLTFDGSTLSVQTTASNDILNLFETGGSEVFTVLESGNVGIGDTSPNALLDILNNTAIGNNDGDQSVLARFDAELDTNQRVLEISAVRNAAEGASAWHDTSIRLEANVDNNSTAQQWIEFRSKSAISGNQIAFGEADGDATEWMVIDDGNVGIGTTSPTNLLHVEGQIFSSADTRSNTFTAENGGGDASSPQYGFADPDTGMFWAGGDTLGFTTGGSEAVRITSSGNVGIGTTTPSGQLNVYQSSGGGTDIAVFERQSFVATSPAIAINNTSNNGAAGTRLSFRVQGTERAAIINQLGSGITPSLQFVTNGSEQMRIDSSGNVGIGTDDPEFNLSVEKDDGLTSGQHGLLWVARDSSLTERGLYGGYIADGSTTTGAFIRQGGLSDGILQLGTGGAKEALTIDASGNVGIGTTTPNNILSIVSDVAGTVGNKITLANSNATSEKSEVHFSFPDSSQFGWSVGADLFGDGSDNFYIYGGGTGDGATRLFIDDAGNVGIGTTSPLSKLHVSGGTGSVNLLLEADTDNNGEDNQPSLTFSQDGGSITGEIGFFDSSNSLTIKNTHNDSVIIGTNNTDRLTISGSGAATFTGSVAASSFSGDGSSLTALNASNITSGTLDISDHTNLSAGTNITLSGDTLNVDDAFVLNTGDVMSGALDLNSDLQLAGNLLFNSDTSGDYIGHATQEGVTYYENGSATWRLSGNGNNFINGGNVGIGTTDPGYELDVVGAIKSDTRVNVQDGVDGWLQLNPTSISMLSGAAGGPYDTLFSVDSSSAFFKSDVLIAGDLDIGDGLLEVEGKSGNPYHLGPAQNFESGVSIRAASNPAGPETIFGVESSGSLSRFGVTQSAGAWAKDGFWVGDYDSGYVASATTTGFDSSDGSTLELYANGSQYLTILSGGNVGIGDTDPASLFTVGSGDALQINNSGQIIAGEFCPDGTCDITQYEGMSAGGVGASNIYSGQGGEIDIQDQINFNSNNMLNVDIDSGAINNGVTMGIVTMDNNEPGNLSADGDLSFDSSRGLILYRTQQIGDASGNGGYTVLDSSNITGGTGISISGNATDEGGSTPIEFSVNCSQIAGNELNCESGKLAVHDNFNANYITVGGGGTSDDVDGTNDLYVTDDLEVDGTFYLTGGYSSIVNSDVAEVLVTESGKERLLCNGDPSCVVEEEYVKDELDEGELVCINPEEGQTIQRCTEAYAESAVGFVSNTAALNMGNSLKVGYPIAVAGVVEANVTNVNGDVNPGDLLVAAERDGYAMKMGRDGKGVVVGKAYDFCHEDACKIITFVALGDGKVEQNASSSQPTLGTVTQDVVDSFIEFGIAVTKTMHYLTNLVVDNLFAGNINANKATINEITTEALRVGGGVTVQDRANGEDYCIFVENGEMQSESGACVVDQAAAASEATNQDDSAANAAVTGSSEDVDPAVPGGDTTGSGGATSTVDTTATTTTASGTDETNASSTAGETNTSSDEADVVAEEAGDTTTGAVATETTEEAEAEADEAVATETTAADEGTTGTADENVAEDNSAAAETDEGNSVDASEPEVEPAPEPEPEPASAPETTTDAGQ